MPADANDDHGHGMPASIFVAGFAALGLAIALCFKVLSPLLTTADSIYYATQAALILFPSSILNLAASPDDPGGANKLFPSNRHQLIECPSPSNSLRSCPSSAAD